MQSAAKASALPALNPKRIYSQDEIANLTPDQFAVLLEDRWWRLNHLYYIQSDEENENGDKVTKKVLFRFNGVQQAIYDSMWYWNLYLKSRQHGVTTFWCIFELDTCLFNGDQKCGLIAHTLSDAKKIFATKVKYPYDNLPEAIKKAMPLKTETKEEFVFDNDSSIFVSTSARSGTLQILHISELGPICAKNPIKAQEIISGSLNALHPGSMASIESTAMGRTGQFYEYARTAQKAQAQNKKLSKLEFKFHFFAWWMDPKNVLDPTNILILPYMQEYFGSLLNKHGIELSPAQKAWYIARKNLDPDGIKSEHPSTWEEAFEASIVGAYFKRQFKEVYEQGRICDVPHMDSALVDTWWDIGMNDLMAIWFTQTIGRKIHLINYFEGSGEGFPYYKSVLDDIASDNKYSYGRHRAPHDISVREVGPGQARFITADNLGLHFDKAKKVKYKIDGIHASRNIFPICWFDQTNCNEGIVHLENYRKEWDELRGIFKDQPNRDEHKHGADAFETMAISHPLSGFQYQKPQKRVKVKKRTSAGWT